MNDLLKSLYPCLLYQHSQQAYLIYEMFNSSYRLKEEKIAVY